MNADFEVELAHDAARACPYRRTQAFDALNRRLAPHLLWLALPGDALLYEVPWPEPLANEARQREVELVSPRAAASGRTPQAGRLFTPWGWTRTAAAEGQCAGADVRPLDFALVARVNSKLWSHALEVEMSWALPGARVTHTVEELTEAAARACPGAEDKWVVKSPYGFAARERVLGRGPRVEGAQGAWAFKRLARGEPLIFQPWLEVSREYGVGVEVSRAGAHRLLGVSDLRTNGAGTGTGYVLGRPPSPHRMAELEAAAAVVCARLRAEGYSGPAGFDALEHAGGLHPLLEVNARYTMGFVALAVERSLRPEEPTFWSTKTGALGG
ncbi:MAG: hypothetical protein QOH49_3792 [Acidobacteriota bacterium]|jgi:hypothetical protein|nr:hypothetical protein [Acidobacteriota bacterium]